MRRVLSPDEMRELEARYMASSATPSIELMERAASKVARRVKALAPEAGRIAIFACGPGGNGGDGLAAARLYAKMEGRSIVLSLADEADLKGDALHNFRRAKAEKDVAFASLHELDRLPTPAVWVDAMYGIGLKRPLSGGALAIAKRMEEDRVRGAKVLAIDIASGLCGGTGKALGLAVRATDTVTFETAKLGHLLNDGLDLTGALDTQSIGIPEALIPAGAPRWAGMEDVKARIKPRARNSHKGTYGHLLIVAGSPGMAGAAVLATLAALQSGAGLVTLMCPEAVLPIAQGLAPCAMCVALPEKDGAVDALQTALHKKTALVIGPGLTTQVPPGIISLALASGLPAVLDADALNLIAMDGALRSLIRPHHVLTPHPGEAARLLGRAIDSPVDAARALRELGGAVILKGASSVIAGDDLTLRTAGCSGLAKGGSGDVLSGIVGALLAQGYDAEDAAWMGAVVHGRAGELAAADKGEMGMTALDVAANLYKVWQYACQ